ncbi:glutamate--cysteine ligase [Kineosporia rhizophila]|uniref:carboxylate-amine ligase n=1 Tax=Kineosporia TaxID=49184 RepID=UPI001E49E72C|nr:MULTISPECIES: glutamate--cysteine ligase [Kineosporia]MCE0540034.1 glutamate--cysteine ligase [Kineosporia rhizophila]GLY19236.1 putative glutamate--cysteine ligase 2 [Kineosporia sp. NBRC 101677]
MSRSRTVGVEEEFLLVDEEGVPSPAGPRVATGADEGIEHELQQEQAETGSRPRTELGDLARDLDQRRRNLARRAARSGVSVAGLGLSPVAIEPTLFPEERYRHMAASFGPTATEVLTCGVHVHVGIESEAEGIVAINGVQPWLSVVLALSANSPFHQGADTGYASYRRQIQERWPSAGPTAPFRNPADYHAMVETLISSGVIIDTGMVYYDARLSARYPTVEIRVADVGAEPDSALVVAALCRALVDSAAASGPWPVVARPELLRGAAWLASRHGLTGELLDPVSGQAFPAATRVQQLVDQVRHSLIRHGDLDLVESKLHDLLEHGTGAERQRAAFARRGAVTDVVLDAVERGRAVSAS